jgi:molybdate transport system ATP-binding protein
VIDIDLQVRLPQFALEVRCALSGRVHAIVGPSGSGKTTLLESIAGIRGGLIGRIEVDGEVFLDSARAVTLPPEQRRVGFVPQDAALFPHMTVRRNLLFPRHHDGLEGIAGILEIRHLLERFPAGLSGGERQRVALARALMSQPRLLLLDEPLAALDQPLRERLLLYLRRIRDQFQIPMVYVTHQIAEAMALADFAVVLNQGKVVASGAADQVLHDPSVAGHDAVENVMVVDQPQHFPDRGTTEVLSAEGLRLVLPYDEVRELQFPLVISVRGDDVVVFTERPRAISARNLLRARIGRIARSGSAVDMAVDTPHRLYVRATLEAAEELDLREGSEVWLALRAHAIRVIG